MILFKNLERRWRALWIAVITRLLRRPGPTREGRDGPTWDARPHRVLFLRHDRAGDMILTTPVLREIARSHATIALDVLASPANASLLRHVPWVREVIVFDKRRPGGYVATLRRLRRARYDAVVDCMVTAPSLTTLLLMLASGARWRIGVAGRGNDDAITLPVTVPPPGGGNHMVDHLARLAAPFGVDPARMDRTPTLSLGTDERAVAEARWAGGADTEVRPYSARPVRILVNVSAGTAPRRWPEERYVAVMQHLHARLPGARMLVIGAPDERERAARIAAGGGGQLVATPGLRDAVALVATADVVFTPDTSIAHAASAFRRPTVAMYIRDTIERWGLRGEPVRNLESTGPTLDSIEVAAACAALDDVMREVDSRQRTEDRGQRTEKK